MLLIWPQIIYAQRVFRSL